MLCKSFFVNRQKFGNFLQLINLRIAFIIQEQSFKMRLIHFCIISYRHIYSSGTFRDFTVKSLVYTNFSVF